MEYFALSNGIKLGSNIMKPCYCNDSPEAEGVESISRFIETESAGKNVVENVAKKQNTRRALTRSKQI